MHIRSRVANSFIFTGCQNDEFDLCPLNQFMDLTQPMVPEDISKECNSQPTLTTMFEANGKYTKSFSYFLDNH